MSNFDLIVNEIDVGTIFIDRHIDELGIKINSIEESIDVFRQFINFLDDDILDIFAPILTLPIEGNNFDRRIGLVFNNISYNDNEPPSIGLIQKTYINNYSGGGETYIREINDGGFGYKSFYICHRGIYFVNSGEEYWSQGVRIYG